MTERNKKTQAQQNKLQVPVPTCTFPSRLLTHAISSSLNADCFCIDWWSVLTDIPRLTQNPKRINAKILTRPPKISQFWKVHAYKLSWKRRFYAQIVKVNRSVTYAWLAQVRKVTKRERESDWRTKAPGLRTHQIISSPSSSPTAHMDQKGLDQTVEIKVLLLHSV